MGFFRLDPEPSPGEAVPLAVRTEGLTVPVMLSNARWFTRIRWVVVVILMAFAVAGLLVDPELLRRFGLLPPAWWPLQLAGILILLNLGFIRWVRHLATRASCPWRMIAANLWFQIVSDLAVLTVLVYRTGPTSTVMPCAYLFHITLACIFFERRDSLLVTLLSALLFLTTVIVEGVNLLPPARFLVTSTANAPDLSAATLALATVFGWFVVWYLTSSLSETVRRRDRDLAAANERVRQVDEAINQQMLRITHDLKAPFSGIETNIQLLKHVHWQETPEKVRQIIDKIEARSATLRPRIDDILTLGSLRTNPAGERIAEPVTLRGLLGAILQEVHGLAVEKKVSIELSVDEAKVLSDPTQLKMLFSNLISNAVAYSRNGGVVDVGIEEETTQVRIRIADQGIGISDKALPHIFEDFFHAQEAIAFNPNSTGLGLAIVRQIARNLHLAVTVESVQGKGTAFEVFIPKR